MARKARSFIVVDAVGTREMVAAFTYLGRRGVQEQIIAPTLSEGVDILYNAVESSVPVGKTGKLKGSLRKFVSKTRARVVIGGGKQYYGRFLEYGTAKMRARPFMRPAMDGNRRRIEAIAVRHMKAVVARLAKGGSVFSSGGSGRFNRRKAA